MYLLESPGRGDSNKYTKCIIYKNKCSKVSGTNVLDGSFQVSLHSKFDFTAKSSVTNTVVITRVLRILPEIVNEQISIFSDKAVALDNVLMILAHQPERPKTLLQSNFSGANTFGTMKISSRQV